MRRAGSLRTTTRSATVPLPLDVAWAVAASGHTGSRWYADAAPFRLRGALDRLVGGDGRRWAPPGTDLLAVGDHAGFWEVVEADHARHRFVLEARVRAPGVVRMETTATPAIAAASPGEDAATEVAITISLAPRGVLGAAYLVADLPARSVVTELTMLHLLAELGHAAP